MDFLLGNDVEFQYDGSDDTYVATIKIVNNQAQEPPQQHYDYVSINRPADLRLTFVICIGCRATKITM